MGDVQRHLAQEIADLEARLAELKARLPAHSIPPSMIMEMEDLEERLADARARLAAEGEGEGTPAQEGGK